MFISVSDNFVGVVIYFMRVGNGISHFYYCINRDNEVSLFLIPPRDQFTTFAVLFYENDGAVLIL